MHRFFMPQIDFNKPVSIISDPKEIHHAKDVLRLKMNDAVTVFNGLNQEADGRIVSITSHKLRVQITRVHKFATSHQKIILACAIPKKSKFEFIIEKATELGVGEIIPLKTQRTEINLQDERLLKKNLRYQTVAANAAKQCQRVHVPWIHPMMNFKEAVLNLNQRSMVIIPSLIGERTKILSVFQKLKNPQTISFLIGPEGDFTPEEYAYAFENNGIPVSLGETILKVETAALSVISLCHLWFDANPSESSP